VGRQALSRPKAIKRQVTKTLFTPHQRKSTFYAVWQAVKPLGYLIAIREPGAGQARRASGPFRLPARLHLSVLNPIIEAMQQEVGRLIHDARSVGRHLLAHTITLENHRAWRIAW